MRLHELAKELDESSKVLLSRLEELKLPAKSHMSALSDEQVEALRKSASGNGAPAAKPAAPQSEAPAPKENKVEEKPAPNPEPKPAPKPEPRAEKKPEPKKPAPRPPEPAKRRDDAPANKSSGGNNGGESKVIIIKGSVTVREFAEEIGMRPNQVIAELMSMNVFASINERLDLKIATKIADKHGFKVEHEKKTVEHKPVTKPPVKEEPENDRDEDLMSRPPVVTFLGHVDHGKTSLLDRIRKAAVAAGEDGGITQHIGAYTVDFQDRNITFIDTPGHKAFTAMRARGANLTDIAVIIIAADDGLMPQTREAIQHAKAAEVAIMVAINKTDLATANVDRVKTQLQEVELMSEDWGGETICCEVSAHTGAGIDHLLEMIALQAEILELKANPKRRAQGYVIEAKLEPGMGPTANILVTRGTLKVGDAMVCGQYWGRIKALINDQGLKVRTAEPSFAVKCLGLTNVPDAGQEFKVFPNDRLAKTEAEKRQEEHRLSALGAPARKASLDDLFNQTDVTEVQELPIVLKADVQGSLEALKHSLEEIKSEKVKLKIILSSVGNITENDILLASASNAIVLGFHVSKEGQTTSVAKREGVEIRLYAVIYELIEDVQTAMQGLLKPTFKENIIGHAEIRQVFNLSKKGRIAGCMVTDGRVTSSAKARVIRNREIIFEGKVTTLRRYQNEASEVRDGQECGISLAPFHDFNEGDVIEIYDVEEMATQL